MVFKRDSELQLWRFALALMGGRSIVWMFAVAVACVICAIAYVSTQQVYPLSRPMLYVGMAKMFAVACFLALPLAAAQLYAQCRLHPMLHLMPGGEWRLRALLRRIVVLAALALAAAMFLQCIVAVADRTPPDTLVSMASVESYEWRAWLLYLLGAAAFIWIGASKLRVPLNFVWAPAYMFAMQSNFRMWWMPLAFAVVFMGVPWLYQRITGEAPKRRRMLDENVYMVLSDEQPRDAHRKSAQQWWERWRAWRLRRTLGAPKHKRVIALAAMSQETQFTRNWIGVVLLGLAIAFVPFLTPSSWGFASNMLLGMIVFPFVVPGPVSLAPLWLLPIGVLRDRWGELLVAAWMQRLRFSIACAVALGSVLMLIKVTLFPEWQLASWRDSGAPTVADAYLWPLILMPLVVHGIAYTAYVTSALWPPGNAAKPIELLPLLTMFATPVVAGAGLVAADVVAAKLSYALPAIGVYVVTFGAVLPLAAWALLRTRRVAWAKADIASISARYSAWGLRIEDATSFAKDVQVTRDRAGKYVLRR